MATIIYDDKFGARTTKVFGCSFKNITAQMGFNSQPIVFTITVVEEKDQDFILDREDVRSVQHISFGELSILGIVQSWERTTVDPNGTGIYVIRLTDCRTVLDSANITYIYVDQPELETALINSNVIYIGPSGDTDIVEGLSREEERGVLFSTIIKRVESATINYGNNIFKVDMSELNSLTNWNGEGVNDYYIEGEIRSLVSIITEFCEAVGAEWWVESRRKSVVDDTIIIQIKIVRRLEGIDYPDALEINKIAALHNNRIIHRTDGYENQDIITNKIIWGDVKQKLHQVNDSEIKQFWGFNQSGQPLSLPFYTISNEPFCENRIITNIFEMENVINGDLNGIMDANKLATLKRYINNFWGKKFYFVLNKNMMSDTGQNLPDYPEIISAGWWEGDTSPLFPLHEFCDSEIFMRMTTIDGRWGPFVLLPFFSLWTKNILNSNNFIKQGMRFYMKCTLQQYGRYVIITLPIALTFAVLGKVDPETGELEKDRITHNVKLSKAWIPIMDRGIHYGPWSDTSLIRNRIPSPGRSEVLIDKDLVPWTFGVRGMLHTTAMEKLSKMAAQKINILPGLSIINTGQLEVAGIPQVNIGQAIGLGSSITEIFTRFDINGITTRYVMNLFTRELGEFKHKKQKKREEQQEDNEIKLEDFPESDLDSITEEGPTQEQMEYIFAKPEGGLGVIDFKEGGPFYTVRRLNYADIDPTTFAGGLNITGSYFLAEWNNVRNLAELEDSPGLLPVGTRVTVSIFSMNDENGPYVPYIEQTPQVFSPPPV